MIGSCPTGIVCLTAAATFGPSDCTEHRGIATTHSVAVQPASPAEPRRLLATTDVSPIQPESIISFLYVVFSPLMR